MEDLGDTYHVAGAYDIDGEFNADAFAGAFGDIVERHEVLRTTFHVVEGTPMQHVQQNEGAQVEFIDLTDRTVGNGSVTAASGVTPEALEATAAEHIRRITTTPFNLERGPLARAAVLRVGPDRHVLLVVIHHIVSDGWSVGILIGELVALYESYLQGIPLSLPPLPIQYRDYAAHQAQQLGSGKPDDSRSYWLEKLAGATPLDLPLDRPRPARKSYRGGVETFTLGAEIRRALEQLATQNGASTFMVLAALLKTLLHRYTGHQDITVGTAIAGRNHVDLENQVGFYVNVLPLRTEVLGEESFASLLARVRQTATEAYSHQSYPFDKLVDELGVERVTGRSPLFDVFLVLQNNEQQTLRFGDAILTERTLPSTPNKYDLSFDFSEDENGLHCEVNYNTDVFFPERIRNLAAHFTTLTEAVLSGRHNEMPVATLPMLTEEEMREVTKRGKSRKNCGHSLSRQFRNW